MSWGHTTYAISLFMALIAVSLVALEPRTVILTTVAACAAEIELSCLAHPGDLLAAAINVAPMAVLGAVGAVAVGRMRALTRERGTPRRAANG